MYKNEGKNLIETFELSRSSEQMMKWFVSQLYKFTKEKPEMLSKIVVEFKMDEKDIKRIFKLLKK